MVGSRHGRHEDDTELTLRLVFETKAARRFRWNASGRNTGDNLLSHLSGEALPSAVCRLNERVRDGDVCFPAPILTRGSIPDSVVRLSLITSEVSGKSVNSSSCAVKL